MTKASVMAIRLIRFQDNHVNYTEDLLSIEEPLEIRLGFGPKENRQQQRISVTMRTPGNDFELALGFLFTEGIVKNAEDILNIQYCTELNSKENLFNVVRVELKENIAFDSSSLQRNFYTTSSCGVCGKASIDAVFQQCDRIESSVFEPSPSIIFNLTTQLDSVQTVFKYTGGIHASALFDKNGKLLLVREDVGRHNALDKLIGAVLADDGINFSDSILLLSGRASFELVQKAAMARIPNIVAVGAPSSLAVSTAEEFGIRLYGFLKENKYNQYTKNAKQ
ncbi:MAG: formate dehydrogenase accessory sulfurtransferase FdhD [bacterium]|nr:formate dehydrogenase accessory sulfurtransferase FdhD [bacterium]